MKSPIVRILVALLLGVGLFAVDIAPASAATLTPFQHRCYTVKDHKAPLLKGDWRKTRTTRTVEYVTVKNDTDWSYEITELRLTDETNGKYVNGPTGTITHGHSSAPWSPAKAFPIGHKLVLRYKGWRRNDASDTVNCGVRP